MASPLGRRSILKYRNSIPVGLRNVTDQRVLLQFSRTEKGQTDTDGVPEDPGLLKHDIKIFNFKLRLLLLFNGSESDPQLPTELFMLREGASSASGLLKRHMKRSIF